MSEVLSLNAQQPDSALPIRRCPHACAPHIAWVKPQKKAVSPINLDRRHPEYSAIRLQLIYNMKLDDGHCLAVLTLTPQLGLFNMEGTLHLPKNRFADFQQC